MLKEDIYDKKINFKSYDMKTSNDDLEKTGDKILSQNNLLDITKIKEYCSKNSIFSENFELLNYVDSGSESIVWSGLFKKTKKKVLFKIIFNNKRKKIIEKNEIEIASKLKYKNIIDFYGYDQIIKDESYFILMEYEKYGNLINFERNILGRANLSESMICYLAYQILEGLIYCHKCKIAHMDLKPKNIVVGKFLNIKLIDFSISINYQGKKLNEEIKLPSKGTSLYMPIEVITSQKIKYKDLNKVDLYAFGVTLYYLAFGNYPYNLTNEDEDNYKKIYEKIYIKNLGIDFENNHFSTYFLNFLNKLLEKDINKRINIFEAKDNYWIKGANILLEEKENLNNLTNYINHLLTNQIRKFNEYIGKNT